MFFSKMGIDPTTDKGITISVRVPEPLWCSAEQAKICNREAYDSIINHKDLYAFIKCCGHENLEYLKDCPYTRLHLWIRINHIEGQNLLIVTHGHGPDRGECYYRAETYEEFWDIVRQISEICENPEKPHKQIVLKQNNQMCGVLIKNGM